MNRTSTSSRLPYLLLRILLLAAVFALPAGAGASIGARYQSISGNKVVFLVQVDSPPPASIIIQHFHPPGRKLLRASPAADKSGSGSGSSKWLLKNVRPGIYPFSLSFDGAASSDIKIILRYHDPATGSFLEKSISP